MKTIAIVRYKALLWALLFTAGAITAQNRYKESFKASKDMLVSVNTSYTNIIFETWDKNEVEVEAFVEDKNLSEKQQKEIFENWKFDVLGNSQKVVVTSNPNNYREGIGALAGLDALKSLESLKALQHIDEMPELAKMPEFDFDFNFDVPEVPDFKEIPQWPFSENRPNIKRKEGYKSLHIGDEGEVNFDQDVYEKDKSGYVAKLNKKYGTNVSVKQVDRWLEEVDQWAEEFSAVMENWGEQFGKNISDKFGPDFEKKMEAWGEEFGKSMEAWGEEFGEKFGKDMEKWGEEFGEKFGKDMEKWGEEFGKSMEEWAKQFEEEGGSHSNKVIIDPNGNKTIIMEGKKDMSFGGKANKTIIVRMPKGTKTEVNVRYGELKLANAYNLKATLNYSTLTANSIDGGQTRIDASYAPVFVNQWKQGVLKINFVEDCRLNSVSEINLQSNNSDVTINDFQKRGKLAGSFGNLYILKVSPEFKSLEVVLENTDASLNMPNTAFDFYYNGKKSQLAHPKSIKVTETKNANGKTLKGFNKSGSSGKSINITANYSNVNVQ
jgi:hypothetical protein